MEKKEEAHTKYAMSFLREKKEENKQQLIDISWKTYKCVQDVEQFVYDEALSLCFNLFFK